METRIFYRVITPNTFSNLDCSTLEMARKAIVEFGRCDGGEYAAYWKEQAAQCVIVKVTETIEPVTL